MDGTLRYNRRSTGIGGVILVTIQQTERKKGIRKLNETAKKDPYLKSEVHKIDFIDPYLFFSGEMKSMLENGFFGKILQMKNILLG